MNFQFLPHYFKYIGLVLFITYFALSGMDDFMNGYKGLPYDSETMSFGLEAYLNKKLFDIVGLVGILIYALSKDRVFDEFMMKRRLENAYIIFFGTLILILVMSIIEDCWTMNATVMFEAQIILFLILNKFRKYTAG